MATRELMAHPARMHMTGAQRKWKRNLIRWRWGHLLWPLLVFCRAFVSPVTRQALGAPEKEAMEAEVVGPPASLEAGTLEVVGENTSAPVRLLYSTGRGESGREDQRGMSAIRIDQVFVGIRELFDSHVQLQNPEFYCW